MKKTMLINHPEWHPEVLGKARKHQRLGPTLAELLRMGVDLNDYSNENLPEPRCIEYFTQPEGVYEDYTI